MALVNRSSRIRRIIHGWSFAFGIIVAGTSQGFSAWDIAADCSQDGGELEHFWTCVGGDLKYNTSRNDRDGAYRTLFSPLQRQNLSLLGTVPHGSIRYVRYLFLLDMVGGSDFVEPTATYDFTKLDEALDLILAAGLKPFIQLMGYPADFISFSRNDSTFNVQKDAWRNFMKEFVTHIYNVYGESEVKTWYIEEWNELGTAFWPYGPNKYNLLYEAIRAGIDDVDPSLKLAAPASEYMLEKFFAHINDSTNAYTGEKGTRLDIFTVHVKGDHADEDLNLRARTVTDKEIEEFHELIDLGFTDVVDIPFMNTEADPIIGWNSIMKINPSTREIEDVFYWRGNTEYAAYVASCVYQHQKRIVDSAGIDLELVSNDNAFITSAMDYRKSWLVRSHFVAFGDSAQFSTIKKPVHNVMTMLGMLGNQRCVITQGEPSASNSDSLGIFVTKTANNEIAALLFNYRLTQQDVSLTFNNLPFDSAVLAHYRIDNDHTNPYPIWPDDTSSNPPEDKLNEMRMHNEVEYYLGYEPGIIRPSGGSYTMGFKLPKNAISLVVLTPPPSGDVDTTDAQNVRVEEYGGLYGKEYLVLWDDLLSKRTRTYEVLYSETENGTYTRVNDQDILCTGYIHAGPSQEGYYKVQAVDYWDNPVSEYEIPVVNPVRNISAAHFLSRTMRIPACAALSSYKIVVPPGAAGFSVYTVSGRKVYSYSRKNSMHTGQVRLDRKNLNRGVYLVKYESVLEGN
ncbi:MAG: hypothetical protein GF350_08470 [Chitinivibrionales bacterium]|nr:hypothetical protein [Chitinivibrionales bacterium]